MFYRQQPIVNKIQPLITKCNFLKLIFICSCLILHLNGHEEIQTMIKMLCQDMSNRLQNQNSNEEKKTRRGGTAVEHRAIDLGSICLYV